MGEERGKVSRWGPHRGDVSSMGWWEVIGVAPFHYDAAVGGNVWEVLQLCEGKGAVRHEENRRRKRLVGVLTEGEQGWRRLQMCRSRQRIPPARWTNGNVGSRGR
jgi:hypothetical protein